jgi:hypothetical protein
MYLKLPQCNDIKTQDCGIAYLKKQQRNVFKTPSKKNSALTNMTMKHTPYTTLIVYRDHCFGVLNDKYIVTVTDLRLSNNILVVMSTMLVFYIHVL